MKGPPFDMFAVSVEASDKLLIAFLLLPFNFFDVKVTCFTH
jgi:hypothetical protein